MNEYDSNRILDFTRKINYNLTNNIDEANCYLLNTCHIREKATDKVYHEVGRLKKRFKNKKKPIVLIAGCVAQAEGEILIKKENYIDAVVGPQSYHEINRTILNLEKKGSKINSTEFEAMEKFDKFNYVKNSNSNISSFLTIQEGCDKFCKFCVVPYTRGPEFSRPVPSIVAEANQLVENGAQEIILLGQNVNAYQFKNYRLSDLLYKLSENNGLKRLRYTTSHPKDFTKDLVKAHIDCEKIMPLIHLPVQSGSNKILKEMNRGHTLEEYYEIIEEIQNNKPLIKFSSDFIIGYPGETDDDFIKSISLLKKVNFINSFSFIYSPRPGTPAANLKIIDDRIAKSRLEKFQSIADKIKRNYRKTLVNKFSKVLFENRDKKKKNFFGRDEYFNSVIVSSEENLVGKIKDIKINEYNQNTLFGKIVDMNKVENAA